jgi:hypothetical protein
MKIIKKFLPMLLIGFMSMVLSGCGDSSASGDPVDNPLEINPIIEIVVTPQNLSLPAGVQQTYKATAVYRDNTTVDITRVASWSTGNRAVATITDGILTTVAAGTTTVTASYKGVSTTTNITVTAATLTSVHLTPQNLSLPAGIQRTYKAIGVYSDNTTVDITRVASWSTGDSAVAIITDGVLTTVAAGTTTVTASYKGVSTTTNITVTDATLQSLSIVPNDIDMYIDETQTFAVVGTYSDGNSYDVTKNCSFTSSDTNIVTIVGNEAKAISEGSVTITATMASTQGNLSATANVRVSAATLQSITITKAEEYSSLDDNKFIVGTTIQAKAIGHFSDGKDKDITSQVIWSTGNEGTITVDENGLVKAIKAGPATLKAYFGRIVEQIEGYVEKATPKEIYIDGPHTSPLGTNINLEAIAILSNDKPLLVTSDAIWSSDNPEVIVSNGVVYSPKAEQSAVITAKFEGLSASYKVTFTEATPVGLEIQESYCADGNCPVVNDKTVDIYMVDDVNYNPVSPEAYYPTAWLVYSDGSKRYVNTEAFWWSDNQDAAYVNFLKGSFIFGRDLAQGVKITARYAGFSANFFVNVKAKEDAPVLESIELRYGSGNGPDITDKTVNLAQGDKFWIEAWGHWDNGEVTNINSKVFYNSSDISKVWIFDPINSYVHARRDATGDAVITATWQGKTASTTVHVIPAESIGDDVTAKNAASLNGVLYPVVLPVFNALRSLGNVIPSVNDTGSATEIVACDPNDETRGTYTITRTTGKVVIDYGVGTCKANNAESVTKRALQECGMTFLEEGNGIPMIGFTIPNDANVSGGSYYVLTEGVIECTKATTADSTTLSMILKNHKSEQHNHSSGNNNVWTHDMVITLQDKNNKTTLSGSGNSEVILYEGEVDTPVQIQSHEIYYANNFAIELDLQKDPVFDTLKASGEVGYALKESIWFPENAGKVYTINFDNYTYSLNGDNANTEVKIDGIIGSNCMGGAVYYETSQTLLDNRSNKDDNGSRIPESGQINLASVENNSGIITDTKAFMQFNASNPRINITVNGSTTKYNNWREITTTSECSILQEFMDRAFD